MAKIYVGNLPFSADEAAVRTLFSQHGTVESVSLPVDRDTGRPRGFGFVEMPQEDAADALAIALCHTQTMGNLHRLGATKGRFRKGRLVEPDT